MDKTIIIFPPLRNISKYWDELVPLDMLLWYFLPWGMSLYVKSPRTKPLHHFPPMRNISKDWDDQVPMEKLLYHLPPMRNTSKDWDDHVPMDMATMKFLPWGISSYYQVPLDMTVHHFSSMRNISNSKIIKPTWGQHLWKIRWTIRTHSKNFMSIVSDKWDS